MMVRLIAVACAVLMLIGMAPVNAGQGGADSWTPREMGDPGKLKGKALKLPLSAGGSILSPPSFAVRKRRRPANSSLPISSATVSISAKTAPQSSLYTRRAGSYRRSKQPLRRFAPSGSEAQRSLLPPARYGQERHRRGPAFTINFCAPIMLRTTSKDFARNFSSRDPGTQSTGIVGEP